VYLTAALRDLEGRLHMLDYDKKFSSRAGTNLTFDGRRFADYGAAGKRFAVGHRLAAFYWGPADYFGAGKVLVFGDVIDKGGTPYAADIRGILKLYAEKQFKDEGYTLNAANEIEGFLFNGVDAERRYNETGKFEYVNTGGYYHSLPGDLLRTFIDTTAEVQRAMGFRTRKTIRKWRLRSLKSITGMEKLSPPPTRSRSTNWFAGRWRQTWV